MSVRHAVLHLSVAAVFAAGAAAQEEKLPPIREFGIEVIESLGRRMFEQDQYAARATDILVESVGGPEVLARKGVRGWVVTERDGRTVVRFVKEEGGELLPAYDIAFDAPGRGTMTPVLDPSLTAAERSMFNARQLAMRSIPRLFSNRYNTVILPNEGGAGYLVYALAATVDPNLIVIGGHYRFTVSADGERIVRTDRLSAGGLTMDRRRMPPDATMAGVVFSHVVSRTPVETHVFANLLYRIPFHIVTPDGRRWMIDEGKITDEGIVPDAEYPPRQE